MSRRWPAGIVDTHVHTGPDYVPRLMNDLEVAREADAADYRAVVLKSHHSITAARATLAEAHTEGARVFGGVVLNVHATGGINPYAVETAIALDARIVWLPTFTSANQIRYGREIGHKSPNLGRLGTIEGDGLELLDADGAPLPELCNVLDQIAAAGVTLATGHVSPREIMTVVPEARRRGVSNVIVTHPELSCVGLGLDEQVELAELGGVWFERVLAIALPSSEDLPLEQYAQAIRTVGVGTTIMATDFGQPHNPSPIVGMQQYIERMRTLGFPQDDIEAMTCANPANALGLDEDP